MNALKIGFIGGGKMAQAMAKGFIQSGLVAPSDILVSDTSKRLLRDIEALKVETTISNKQVVKHDDVVFLAVKPDITTSVLQAIAPEMTNKKLLVSMAAGVSIDTIEKHLPHQSRVIRVMPNMPAVVQSGASVFSRGQWADERDGAAVQQLLECIGMAEEMPEEMLDAVTGLSGSGPAYAFVIIQALADGGVRAGLPRKEATRLAAYTLLGAAKVVLETGRHPEVLKDEVCSPGGTTIHGVRALEEGGIRAALSMAVQSSTQRAKELGDTS